MRDARLITIIVALTVLAGLTRWVLLYLQDREADNPSVTSLSSDYTLSDFELRVMNDQGKPSYVLAAPRLERNPIDGSASVDDPDLTFFDRDQTPWFVKADEGWVRNDGQEVKLLGAVLIRSSPAHAIEVRTEDLVLLPNLDQARTGAHVTINQPGYQLSGTGLDANFRERQFQIRQDSLGTFEG